MEFTERGTKNVVLSNNLGNTLRQNSLAESQFSFHIQYIAEPNLIEHRKLASSF